TIALGQCGVRGRASAAGAARVIARARHGLAKSAAARTPVTCLMKPPSREPAVSKGHLEPQTSVARAKRRSNADLVTKVALFFLELIDLSPECAPRWNAIEEPDEPTHGQSCTHQCRRIGEIGNSLVSITITG